MNLLIFAIFLLCIYRLKFSGKNYFDDYLSREKTAAINGIFVLLVFYRHYSGYADTLGGKYDNLTIALDAFMGQMIVVPFLFFSGYGIMRQICQRGNEYINSIPKDRILKVWSRYAVAVFLVVDICIGNYYNPLRVLGAFFAWTDIGNSNWYIFAILMLYIFTYISFKIVNNKICSIVLLVCMCVIYIIGLLYSGNGRHYYNTILTYPAGMVYALTRDSIEKNLQKSNLRYFLGNLLLDLFFCFLCLIRLGIFNQGHWYYNDYFWQLFSIVFILVIVFISMKVSVNNRLLQFLGKYTFEIYILQRIPLMLFSKVIYNKYILFLVSLGATLLISVLFKWFIDCFIDICKRYKKI